jgi:type I restriction enzyme S subunit
LKSEQEVAVSEITDIVIGGTPKTNKPEYWGGTIKWASAKDISNCKGRYIYETEKTITQEGLKNSAAKLLPENTIVITSRGTVGEMCLLPYPMSFNQTCYGLITKEGVDPLFLFYKLKTLMGKINSLSYGTVFDTITKRNFDDLRITLPSLPEQQKIASILSAFDDKIELNNQMNRTLEEMASAIFKSWFVDFEPFQDGEFEYSEELGREIPKGWKVKRIGEVCKTFGGGTPNTNEQSYWDGGDIYWATPTDITALSSPIIFDTARKITQLGLEKSSAKLLPVGAVLMTSRATLGDFGH